MERFIYVGCVHGGNERIYEELEVLLESPNKPDFLIFTGDITGSPELEKLKKWFYDTKETGEKKLQKYDYFGDWAATLPRDKRKELVKSIRYAVESLTVLLKRLQARRIKILLVQGNWDNPKLSGVNALKGNDIENDFVTPAYLQSHGFNFINTLLILHTKTSLHIFLPYITLLYFDTVKSDKINHIQNEVTNAKGEGKSVILVGHAEANWKIHHLGNPQHLSGERGKVIRNFSRAMALFTPDEVIYPHQHSRIRDEIGNFIDLNEKYLLHVTKNGVRLVEDISNGKDTNKDILATYIPFGYLAQEDIQTTSI